MDYNSVADNSLHSFLCCLPILRTPTKFQENSRAYKEVVQGHRSCRQPKVHMRLPIINSRPNFGVSFTVFEILMFKARKWLVFPTSSLFDARDPGNPLEFLGKLNPQTSE